jgi:hypothetical protein
MRICSFSDVSCKPPHNQQTRMSRAGKIPCQIRHNRKTINRECLQESTKQPEILLVTYIDRRMRSIFRYFLAKSPPRLYDPRPPLRRHDNNEDPGEPKRRVLNLPLDLIQGEHPSHD